MLRDFGQRRCGDETEIGRAWRWSQSLGFELMAEKMKIDLLHAKTQRFPSFIECLELHAENIQIEGASTFEIRHREYEMIEMVDRDHRRAFADFRTPFGRGAKRSSSKAKSARATGASPPSGP